MLDLTGSGFEPSTSRTRAGGTLQYMVPGRWKNYFKDIIKGCPSKTFAGKGFCPVLTFCGQGVGGFLHCGHLHFFIVFRVRFEPDVIFLQIYHLLFFVFTYNICALY